MDSLQLKSALIVSDPLHMKRAMEISRTIGVNGKSSPTQTSMYRSWSTKFSLLLYESFFYNIGLLSERYE
ncbi:hypothetical protein R9C00_04440 [Flammeovirgaceae bacterium SG7u.111]|nr:hypothetical protein [Flammeovirgaceae bacterium SG7u.132]WPO36695.1 hypothetical protein R9C00_04440 [Flammeovirgaceae bacterium SG7u.111]